MPEVLIRCPVTGKDVHTGLILHGDVLRNASIDTYPVACPHCGQHHPWKQKDAYLQFPPEREPAGERRDRGGSRPLTPSGADDQEKSDIRGGGA